MEFNYLVKVTAHNEVAGEKQDIQFASRAQFTVCEDGYTLEYNDTSGESPARTVLTYKNSGTLTIDRQGDMKTFIPLECGKRNVSSHELPFGTINLGVTALEIDSRTDAQCGCLRFKYQTDTDGEPLGLMDFYVWFHKKGTAQILHF